MTIFIVHGTQLDEHGQLREEHKSRITLALIIAKPNDIVFLTGGVTRAGFPSESDRAYAYIKSSWGESHPTISLEKASRTTGENIIFVKDALRQMGIAPDHIVAYHRPSAINKTRILYKKLWRGKECCIEVRSDTLDEMPLWYKLLDRTLLTFLAHHDPYEVGFIWKLLKGNFRNPQK